MARFAVAVFLLFLSVSACSSKLDQIRTYNMGERVQAGPLIYNAFDTHWAVSLGEGTGARVPSNRFLIVHISVVNGGATDTQVPTLALVDDSGKSYNEVADGTGVKSWLGIVRKVQPVEGVDGNILFDVEPKHYKLRVADETDQIVSLIDLPLNLDSDPKPQITH